MVRHHFSDNSGETGRLIEELLGGYSVQPKFDPKLVDEMMSKGQLYNPVHNKNPRLKEQIRLLPDVIKKLLVLAEQHKTTGYTHIQEQIRTNMYKILSYFDYNFLFESLLRYSINALPDNYTPWEPGPVGANSTKRNEFISELQEKICEQFNVTDYNKVRFFNVVNTPLDLMFSTDGCFVVDGSLFPDKKRRILPIDITGNMNKQDKGYNASGSMVLYIDMKNMDDAELEKYRESFAKQIKECLLRSTRPDTMLDGFTSKFDQEEISD